jgi:predicted permease
MMVWMERLWQDVRYGCRMLAASPGFAAIAILSLAIGIGANCAIFSIADGLLLRPLPVARPGEIFTVSSTQAIEALGMSSNLSSYPDYVDIRDRSKSFDGLAAFTYVAVGFAPDSKATPKLKMGMLASGNLFSVMGVEPVLGRAFRPDEDQVPGRDAVVVLGSATWEQEFGSEPSVLGRTIRLNGRPFTVIGVAPSTFTGLDQYVRAAFFVPIMMSASVINDPNTASLQARDARNLDVKGRLKPGMSQAEAQAELTTIGADLQRAYPDTNKTRRLVIRTEMQSRIAQDPPDATLIAMLSTLALGVLFVACANVAGLLTSRAPVRAREIALRLAIGAGRARLVRQLVTESLLMAIVGGAAGLAVGYAGIMLFRQIEIPTDLPIALTFQMDRRALLFSLVVAIVSAVLFGLLPAVQATRADLNAVMKSGDSVAPGRRRRWGRALLVCGQVAMSVVLLVMALFMFRGFQHQLAGGPGYRTDHLMMMTIDPTLVRYGDAQAKQFYEAVADRARAVPGVRAVTMANAVPMSNDLDFEPVVPEGYQYPVGKDRSTVIAIRVDESYFDVMNIPVLAGRAFRKNDDLTAPRVAIVNQQFAQRYWPNQDPVGKRIRLMDAARTWVQIVGLAQTSKYIFIAEPPTEAVYLPYRQKTPEKMVLLAYSSGESASLAAPLRSIVNALDPNVPVYNVRTMENLYRMRAVTVFRVLVTTVGAMGLMGLGLSIAGLYGLVAYAATRRTREIGIRMAIGANRAAVLRMVLRQGVVLAVVGLVIGLAASVGAGELLRAAFPMGDNRRDVVALVLVIPIVLAVTFLAAYVPARRASRVSPMQALRYE